MTYAPDGWSAETIEDGAIVILSPEFGQQWPVCQVPPYSPHLDLILHAPDLLAACRAFLTEWDSVANTDRMLAAIAQTRVAIAAAEGEVPR